MNKLQKIKELNRRIKAVTRSASYQDLGQKMDRAILEAKAKNDELRSKINQPANVTAIAIPTKIESDRPEQVDVSSFTEKDFYNMTATEKSELYKKLGDR